MRDLPSLIARALNAPLLIAPAKMDAVLDAIGPRLLGQAALAPTSGSERPERLASVLAPYETSAGTPVTQQGVAILPIVGTMVRRGSWVDAESGTASYGGIETMVRDALADPEVSAVLLDLDTMGGEAGGVFDTADMIAAAARASGKPLWAHANDAALSAGYALAVAADKIWVTRTGEVGSIGVVAAHVDRSAQDAAAGLKWTYIYAGKHKVDGNPHQPLTAPVLADIQAEIDRLYGMFVGHVAARRKLDPAAVRATEARVYSGEQAIALGLADKIGTLAEAAAALAGTGRRGNTSQIRRGFASPVSTSTMEGGLADTTNLEPGAEANTAEPGETQLEANPAPADPALTTASASSGEAGAFEEPAAVAERAAALAAVASFAAKHGTALDLPAMIREGVSAERATALAIVAALATKQGVEFDLAAAIRDGVTADAANRQVLDAMARRDEETPTLTMVPTSADAGQPVGSRSTGNATASRSLWDRVLAKRNRINPTGKAGN
jgi:signal peptide peptidase SppA